MLSDGLLTTNFVFNVMYWLRKYQNVNVCQKGT